MLWSGLVRVRRTSRFWFKYQFCLRNIWKHPQLIWRVENRWKHLQVLLKMTTVTWTAVCSVVGCFNNHWYNYIIVFPLKYYLQHVSVLTVCSCMWTISWFVFPSSPRVMSAPWRLLSFPLHTLYSDQNRCGGNCVNLLIRPPRRSCTANIQTHLLPLCVGGRWVKVVKGWRHLYSWKQRESADGCFQEREKVLRYRFTVFVF